LYPQSGLPADNALAIIRIKQWQQDRAALATSRTTDYTRTGWKQRNHRTADARIVRVLDFERAFAMLEEEHQLALALIYRDNQPQDKAADAIGCSQRKLCYLLPEARQNLANILNRLDLL
jgi:DNA-directed RNA polymerase specialized sigma24 family protein